MSSAPMTASVSTTQSDVRSNAVHDGIVDTHIHVFDPQRYPFADSRAYTPGVADIDDVKALAERMGTRRFVLVQPSPYGTDNRALLDTLEGLGPERARGIACVDTSADPAESAEVVAGLKASGVVGIRFNRNSDPHAQYGSLADELAHHIDFCAWHDMAVQLFCKATDLTDAAPAISASPVPVILDHFGGVKARADGLIGEDTVLRLAASHNVWVKLSAPYRVGEREHVVAHLPAFTRRLVGLAGDRLLWASDWPHTGGGDDRAKRGPHEIEPFRRHDAIAARTELLTWIDDPAAASAILIDNPTRFFGFTPVATDSGHQEGHR